MYCVTPFGSTRWVLSFCWILGLCIFFACIAAVSDLGIKYQTTPAAVRKVSQAKIWRNLHEMQDHLTGPYFQIYYLHQRSALSSLPLKPSSWMWTPVPEVDSTLLTKAVVCTLNRKCIMPEFYCRSTAQNINLNMHNRLCCIIGNAVLLA